MGDTDIVSKRILKNLVRDFAIHLFGLPVTRVELLDTAQQRVEERRADLVAKVAVQDQAPCILHIEIQTDNQRQMPARMLRYLSDIVSAHPRLPVRQYLVYIGRKPLAMRNGLDFPDFQYRYRIIDLRRVDCDELLRRDAPDAWVLAILCDFGNRLPREIVRHILARLAERFAGNPPRLREYVDMLDTLATNRDLNIDIREELKMLTIDVEKLATYQLGMEKGMEKGVKKGERNRSVAIAKKLLAQGMEPAVIAAVTDLPTAEIEALAKPPTQQDS